MTPEEIKELQSKYKEANATEKKRMEEKYAEMEFDRSKDVSGTEERLEKLASHIDGLVEKANEQVENASEEVRNEMKAIEESLKNEIGEKSEEYARLNEHLEKLQDQFDDISTKGDRLGQPGANTMYLKDFLAGAIAENEDIKNIRERGQIGKKFTTSLDFKDGTLLFKGAMPDMESKADNILSTDQTSSATNWPAATVVPGVYFDPDTQFTMRSVIPVNRTTSDTIRYQQETAIDSTVASVAEGSALTQDDADVATNDETVKTIGSYFKISEEMMMDLPQFTAYLVPRLQRKMVVEENRQIIFGDGTSNQLTGINADATAYADSLSDANATRYDVLLNAVTQLQDANLSGEYQPTAILTTHTEYQELLSAKSSSDAHYYIPAFAGILSPYRLTIAGVPVIATSAMQTAAGGKDTFLAGDFRYGCALWDRMSPTVEMTNTDQDDFVKKLVTVRIWERVALTNFRPNAFRSGNMVSALDLAGY